MRFTVEDGPVSPVFTVKVCPNPAACGKRVTGIDTGVLSGRSYQARRFVSGLAFGEPQNEVFSAAPSGADANNYNISAN